MDAQEFGKLFSSILLIMAGSSILSAIIQWSINQWSPYFGFPEVNFWQAMSLVTLAGVFLTLIKNLRWKE